MIWLCSYTSSQLLSSPPTLFKPICKLHEYYFGSFFTHTTGSSHCAEQSSLNTRHHCCIVTDRLRNCLCYIVQINLMNYYLSMLGSTNCRIELIAHLYMAGLKLMYSHHCRCWMYIYLYLYLYIYIYIYTYIYTLYYMSSLYMYTHVLYEFRLHPHHTISCFASYWAAMCINFLGDCIFWLSVSHNWIRHHSEVCSVLLLLANCGCKIFI